MLVTLTNFLLPHTALAREFLVYFGTYTGPKSQGIYVSRFDARTGQLSAPELAAETQNPSFLAVHPDRRQLYAVGEIGDFAGQRTGAVSAFAIEPRTGGLTLLNQQSSGGQGPCHLSLDAKGKFLLVANYGGGSVASLPVRPDGSLAEAVSAIQHAGSSVNPKRQAGPHAHFIAMDPANRFALACDLGLDKVLVYRLEAKSGELIPNDPSFAVVAPGAGPRQLAFSRDAKFVFVLNELSSSLTVFAYAPRGGTLTELQTLSTLPAEFTGNNSCAEVEVHPSGKFVYASNRGHDSLAVFAVEKATGRLTLVEYQPTRGKTPRHFAIDPTGRWLLAENQGDNNVVVFEIDRRTGKLRPTGQVVEVGSPVCAVFVPVK